MGISISDCTSLIDWISMSNCLILVRHFALVSPPLPLHLTSHPDVHIENPRRGGHNKTLPIDCARMAWRGFAQDMSSS